MPQGMSAQDCKAYSGMGDYTSMHDIFVSVPVGTDAVALTFPETEDEVTNTASVFCAWCVLGCCSRRCRYYLLTTECGPQMLGWLSINDISCADTSACNWFAAGINLDDTTGAGGSHGWEAKVRFGLLLNNEGSITTANDAVGFGAREANGGGVGAGHAKYPGILNSQEGTIWIKGR
jgi:hypothetical protein